MQRLTVLILVLKPFKPSGHFVSLFIAVSIILSSTLPNGLDIFN